MSAWWMWLLVIGCFINYLYGWAMEYRNKLLSFFNLILWTGSGFVLKLQDYIQTQPKFPFSMLGTIRFTYCFALFIACFLTFANVRVENNLKNRRGNVSKQQLVQVQPTARERWQKFKRLFVKGSEEKIILNLGEEIPMKD
jgi:hypothetical protein